MKVKLDGLFNFVKLGNASISRGFTFENNYLKFIGTGYYMAYFFFNQSKADLESKKFAIRAEFELTRRVWNLLDTKGIKHALKGILYGILSIKYRKKLYVKRIKKPLTIEYIRGLIDIVQKGKSITYDDNNFDGNQQYLNDTASSFYKSINDKEVKNTVNYDNLFPIVENINASLKPCKFNYNY